MSDTWNVLPAPGEDAEFVQHEPGVVACTLCGALVAERFAGRHRDWHAGAAAAPPARAVTVHGMQSPRPGSAQPYRVVEIASAYPQAETLAKLRTWVAGEKADLGIPDGRGFRATFLPGWLPGPQSLPVRFATDVEPDARGARVTVLLIAALDQFGDAGTRVSGGYEARFDRLEGDVRRLIERR